MKKLIDLDKWLFVKINRDSANSIFDAVMPFLRQTYFWFPLYLLILSFVVVNFKDKALSWLLTIGLTTGLCDVISSRFFKPVFARVRPCNDPDLAAQLHMLAGYCGGNGSFTSSHAANHFGMAVFLSMKIKHILGNWRYLFFVWASLVCYAQVYVGVHFPFDVLGGALLGTILGYIAATLWLKKAGPLSNLYHG
jgi:undecaprenyl-diphosphatase